MSNGRRKIIGRKLPLHGRPGNGDIELLSTPAKEMLKTVKITTRETAAEGAEEETSARNIKLHSHNIFGSPPPFALKPQRQSPNQWGRTRLQVCNAVIRDQHAMEMIPG